MLDTFSGSEILVIAVVALVVFGPQRLPEISRTLGGYLRELKSAVRDLREGIEEEVGPLREPIQEIRKDISKPVTEVRRTLTETADTAKSVGRDLKRSVKEPVEAPRPDTANSTPGEATSDAPQARWIAPEPVTGVSPSKVWEGLDDPVPPSAHPPPDDGQQPDRTEEEPKQAANEGGAPDEDSGGSEDPVSKRP